MSKRGSEQSKRKKTQREGKKKTATRKEMVPVPTTTSPEEGPADLWH